MNVDDLRLLFAYNDWANGRILAAASGLSMAELRAPALPCLLYTSDAADE